MCEMASRLTGTGLKRRVSQDAGAENKHKFVYNQDWEADFPWHIPVYNTSSDSEGTGGVDGLVCSICK